MDTSERRLELVRSVREEQARNLLALKQRESILYGVGPSTYQEPITESYETGIRTFSGFKVRFFFAVMLIAFFWLAKQNHWTFLDCDSGKIFETICETSNSIDFTALFPYTLEE
ncbi:MAG: DUF2400 domain-containing protein [Lachnospiraceae bacterium]|nr:DUF2400 domain-containing protein [Lachnospiraceae bacterium]